MEREDWNLPRLSSHKFHALFIRCVFSLQIHTWTACYQCFQTVSGAKPKIDSRGNSSIASDAQIPPLESVVHGCTWTLQHPEATGLHNQTRASLRGHSGNTGPEIWRTRTARLNKHCMCPASHALIYIK